MVPALPHRLTDARQLLGDHIRALATAVPHCPLAQLVQSIDVIRSVARIEGLGDVETLASRLESAIAARGRSAVILTYLDAMAAALSAPEGPKCANDDAWLASVAVRFAN